MIRIIDGTAYRGKSGQQLKVKAHDLGNGHLEVTASRTTEWEELDWSPMVIEAHEDMMAAYREENAEELRQKHADQSARRAKKRVRQLCKSMGADTLLTLTYRANMTDLALCKAHLKEFNRRLLRVMPDFTCIAAFERQERGAWHVHMATRRIPKELKDRNKQNAVKLKSYDVIRAVWRSVTKDLGGNVDVARRKFHAQRSPAQIASYIAGYIVKEFADGEAWSNRWTKFGKVDIQPALDLGLVNTPLEAVRLAMELVSDLQAVVVSRLDRWKDWYVLHAELPKPHKKTA